jgi:hypothetical protein
LLRHSLLSLILRNPSLQLQHPLVGWSQRNYSWSHRLSGEVAGRKGGSRHDPRLVIAIDSHSGFHTPNGLGEIEHRNIAARRR